MPLPDNFSPWEHLQTVLMQSYNRLVNSEFRDLGDESWSPDITTPRSSLRLACTIRDDDSAPQAAIKMMIFFFVLRGLADAMPDLYTTPTELYQSIFKYQPQVTMYFREDLEDVAEGFKPVDAVISFRLHNQTSQTLNPSEAMQLALKIRSEFATGSIYKWKKGRVKLMYRDKDNGYDLKIHAFNEGEGRAVISKVISIQGHSLNPDYLTISELAQNPPIVPPTEFIYGESRRSPRVRPIANVRFQYAELHIHGIAKAITLVDATLRRRSALLTA